jgi:hypothetical protein
MKFIRHLFSKKSSNSGQQKLEQAVRALLQATTSAEFRQIIEENPELLSYKAQAVLRRLVQIETQTEVIEKIEECRHLLARCREEGVEAVFPIAGWGYNLLGPVTDAHDFANLLKTQFGVSPNNLIQLSESTATRENIIEAFATLDQCKLDETTDQSRLDSAATDLDTKDLPGF